MSSITATSRPSRIVWLFLSLGLASAVGVLTLMPPAPMPVNAHGLDKFYHVVAFAALVFPTAVFRPHRWRSVGILAILYGVMIEVIQPAFGRSAEISDIVADVIGVGAGLLLGLALRRVLWRR